MHCLNIKTTETESPRLGVMSPLSGLAECPVIIGSVRHGWHRFDYVG